ncbi:MAG: AAA family ATPase [Saprospiraceae bacterium]|nr:AAA family ATPase [Pyrinomonadaceae bacterium]
MHITKIELEDIKSHADSTFEFSRGSTAITGENGAGKTTLIEAVAWTLFDLLDYKKDDFVRRGAKKGVARVTFESGLDEREYTVYRDTGTGYYVYDPALKLRIADKKDEVFRFLWQHLGVEPGTDLKSLFRQAIGVPQGTLTAIFLATDAEREKTFNVLLKVEEYRRGADELLKTSRYLDQQIAMIRENIARAEGQLTRFETVEAEHKIFSGESDKLGSDLELLNSEVADKLELVNALDQKESLINELKVNFDNRCAEKARAEFIFGQKQAEREIAAAAFITINSVRADAEKHASILARLRELERERGERDRLRIELAKVEGAIAAVRADQKHYEEDLESVSKAHKALQELKPFVTDQERIESEVEKLRNALAHARAALNQLKSLDEKIERLRESYRINSAQLTEAHEKAKDGAAFEVLQKRDGEIVREVARLQANLERDERFQSEIKNGLCPILSQKCLNLNEGETLEVFVSSQFGELKGQISVLREEQAAVFSSLNISRDSEKYAAQIPTLQTRAAEIGDEGKRLTEERSSLAGQSENLPQIEAEFSTAENALKTLDDPRGRIKVLENEVRREIELRQRLTASEKNLERLESDRRILVEQLESYKDLDSQWAQAAEIRDRTEEAHRVFLANETLAKSLEVREKEFALAGIELKDIDAKRGEAQAEFDNTGKDYDRAQYQKERTAFLELQKRQAEVSATFEASKRRVKELAGELERLAEIRRSMTGEFREKERLEKIAETTTFIRETLKEAAPRVARNYVHFVSLEANQMFREISGNPELTLKWTEDYAIMLEENGHDRPFIALSGGEQMAAALSVRLALLKQLSDIRIAFFDEPTTNMDAERRENLAMQISQIKHFDQLFVISHDDTFHGYMDNEVTVGRKSDD